MASGDMTKSNGGVMIEAPSVIAPELHDRRPLNLENFADFAADALDANQQANRLQFQQRRSMRLPRHAVRGAAE
jgi:hypothetical protein